MTVLTADAFRALKFNPGEQSYAEDYNRLQRQLVMMIQEMFMLPGVYNLGDNDLDTVVPDPEQNWYALGRGADATRQPLDVSFCPFPASGQWGPGVGARQLTVVVPGPIMQFMRTLTDTADLDNEDPALLTYWLKANEVTLTCNVGHATLDRIDVVEMKLEMVDGDTETRVYSQESVRAYLDLAAEATGISTVLQAKSGGAAGNSITLELVADGSGAGSFTNSGNAYTFHFEDAVTTTEDFEDAVEALGVSAPFEIQTASGTPATAFTDPGSVLAATAFHDGTDQILIGSSLVKSRIVQATFQIKEGTPAATPAFPACSSGFVPVMAVNVPALFNSVFTDQMMDMRFPVGGVQVIDVLAGDVHTLGDWTYDEETWTITAGATDPAKVVCPSGSRKGRVLGVGIMGRASATTTFKLQQASWNVSAVSYTDIATLTTIDSDLLAAPTYSFATAIQIADDMALGLANGTRAAGTRSMLPLWSDGGLFSPLARAATTLRTKSVQEKLVVEADGTSSGGIDPTLSMVRWVIAFGMG